MHNIYINKIYTHTYRYIYLNKLYKQTIMGIICIWENEINEK